MIICLRVMQFLIVINFFRHLSGDVRVMQFLMVMNRDILFFESILLPEGCFFCAQKMEIS